MTRTLTQPVAADTAGHSCHFQLIVDVHLLLLSDDEVLPGLPSYFPVRCANFRVLGQVPYSWRPVDRHVHKPAPAVDLRPMTGRRLWTSVALSLSELGLGGVQVPAAGVDEDC